MILTHIIAYIRRWLDYRNTVSELTRLDDRELRDLGINRCDIDAIAHESAFSK